MNTWPSACPFCGRQSIARSYPLSSGLWRCQAPVVLPNGQPGCGRQFDEHDVRRAQWDAEHPNGEIGDDELAAMDAYGAADHARSVARLAGERRGREEVG